MTPYPNLKPFQPGQSGNPNGRPAVSKARARLLLQWLAVAATVENPETKEMQPGTVEDRVILALLNRALKGDVAAIKEVLDTAHGKNQEQHHVEGDVAVGWSFNYVAPAAPQEEGAGNE